MQSMVFSFSKQLSSSDLFWMEGLSGVKASGVALDCGLMLLGVSLVALMVSALSSMPTMITVRCMMIGLIIVVIIVLV